MRIVAVLDSGILFVVQSIKPKGTIGSHAVQYGGEVGPYKIDIFPIYAFAAANPFGHLTVSPPNANAKKVWKDV